MTDNVWNERTDVHVVATLLPLPVGLAVRERARSAVRAHLPERSSCSPTATVSSSLPTKPTRTWSV